MTVKELLTRLIDTLSEEQALRVMEFIVELRGAEPLEPGDLEALAEAQREGYESWGKVRKDLGLDIRD